MNDKYNLKYVLIFFIISFRNLIYCQESIDLNGIKYARSLKLYCGNIIVVGDTKINTYDSTLTNLLFNYTITGQSMTNSADAKYTALAQFPLSSNGLVVITVLNILYIFDSQGSYKFNKNLGITTSNTNFYTLVPYIYNEGKYYFILGYINSEQKAFLQYYSIELENERLTAENYYLFEGNSYKNGITCQIMNHQNYSDILTCFYENTNFERSKITALSFTLNEEKIEKIEMFNDTFEDKAFCLQSQISPDKKNSLVCFVQDSIEKYGYCAVYNIDKNRFSKYNVYILMSCQTSINQISLNYFNEAREFVFSCSSDSTFFFIKFDQNFNPIEIEPESETMYETINLPNSCYYINIYSLILLSNEYKILADLNCNDGESISKIYSISSNYSRPVIYTDSGETDSDINNSDKTDSDINNSDKTDSDTNNNDETDSDTNNNDKTDSDINNSDKINSDTNNNDKTDSDINNSDKIDSDINNSDKTDSDTNNNDETDSDTTSSDINSNSDTNSICTKYKDNEGKICSEIVPIGYYEIDSSLKLIEKCDDNCQSCEYNSKYCLSCYNNYELNQINNICLYKYNYFFNKTLQEMIYLLSNEFCPDILPYEIVKTRECVEECLIEEFINKTCKINKFSENNIDSITDNMRRIVNISNNSNYDVIVDGNNIIYEITTTEVNNENYDISTIDFGECEKILKQNYSTNYLVVFKMDIKVDDSSPKKVEYEVYSPETKQKLNLSLCQKSEIDVYVPLELNDHTNDLYELGDKYGYDILNENDSFYNEICTPYSSEDKTDMGLNDRTEKIFNRSITLCEDGCVYEFYNTTSKKAKCRCEVKPKIREFKVISYKNANFSIIFDIKTITNIELIKCYKLAFSLEGQKGNIGSLIMIVMIICYITIIFNYLIKKKSLLSQIIRRALKFYNFSHPPRKSRKNFSQIIDSTTVKNINHNSNEQQSKISLNSSMKNKNKSIKKAKTNKKKLILKIKNYQNINVIKNANIILKKNQKRNSTRLRNNSVKRRTLEKMSFKGSRKSVISNNKKDKSKYLMCYKYIDDELNILEYKEALKLDKRTYGQYYWSLVKKKQIILFIFASSNDYNIIYIKIGLFIISFCLYFTVNALFFTDKTMHKIYQDKGLYNFLNQLPQVLYSTLISAMVNMIIKRIALTEAYFLELKKEKTRIKALEKSAKLYKDIIFRLNLHFFITLFLLIIYWYYISAFCAVYKNTQIILIENILLCFGLTLIYPFILNIFPGIFRMAALNSSKKDKECYYKFGNLLSLLF